MNALHTESSGHGTVPLALLHGWSLNLRVFDSLCALLGDVARCAAIDLPGHGRSGFDPAQTGGWALPTVAQQLASTLPATPTVLLGWSLGGQVALQFAAGAGARCRALILLCTSARFIADAPGGPGMPPATAAAFRARLLEDVPQAQRDFLDLQVRGSMHAPASLAQLRAALAVHGAADAAALRASLDCLYANDLRPRLESVRVPVLVIAGQYDRVTHPAACRALAESLPDARFLEVPRAGHAPFLSHTPVVADAIREFLAQLT